MTEAAEPSMGITTLGRRTGTAGDERQNMRSAASQAETLVRSIRLIFFGAWPFRSEGPAPERCISLFESRLFNGLRRLKRGSLFLSPFFPAFAAPGPEPVVEAMRSAGLFIGQDCPGF
jgi:hypothetical protein